jgi:hypothetical protein
MFSSTQVMLEGQVKPVISEIKLKGNTVITDDAAIPKEQTLDNRGGRLPLGMQLDMIEGLGPYHEAQLHTSMDKGQHYGQ